MPSYQTLGILQGLSQGIEQGTSNLFSIMEKRAERKREDELFSLKKKEAELSIKEMELGDLDPETIRLQREKLKADVSLQKAKAEEQNILLEDARKTTTERLQDLRNQMNVIRGYDRGREDGLTLPETAPGVGVEGAGLGLPEGWSVEMTMGEGPELKYKTPKTPAYAEEVRTDVQSTLDRVLSGEDYDTEIRNLKLKHPTGLSFDDLQNLKAVRQQASQIKRQAIQELRNAGYPTSDANVKSAMQQLYQGQRGQ